MSQRLPYPSLPKISVSGKAPSIDSDIWLAFQDSEGALQLPTGPYKEILQRLKKAEAFQASAGSTEFGRFAGKGNAENVLFVGMGSVQSLTDEKARVAGSHAYTRLKLTKSRSGALHLDSLEGLKVSGQKLGVTAAFVEGFLMTHYEFQHRKGQQAKGKKKHFAVDALHIVCGDSKLRKLLEDELPRVEALVEGVNVARHWSNEPSNFGTPVFYAEEATRLAKEAGLKVRVLTEKECQRENMGLFLGVGQGSERESRLVILEHVPAKKSSKLKKIALVGKGVTFDSGGISIKPSAFMENMRHDMTGAASVMGAMLIASRWNVPHHVVGVLAFAENMPDGTAIQPGNVLTARSGKTVEIINTDAEGRLVLADALDYVQDLKPDVVIDLATLTGAVSVALGKICCGLMGNDDALVESIRKAGERAGEKLWQLPLFDEYLEDIKSEIADLKNSVNDSNGGTIRGGMFLKQFIRKGVAWAHLDIAGVAYNVSHLPYFPKKGASGAMVRTLGQYLANE
jgi:leucyl aminopeptidase